MKTVGVLNKHKHSYLLAETQLSVEKKKEQHKRTPFSLVLHSLRLYCSVIVRTLQPCRGDWNDTDLHLSKSSPLEEGFIFHLLQSECMASFLIEVILFTALDLHIQLIGICHCVRIWVVKIKKKKRHLLLVTTKHFHVHDGTCTCTQNLVGAPRICLQQELLSPVCVLQMSRIMETYCLHIQWRRTSLPGRGIK